MIRTRGVHGATFKARVALAAVRPDKTPAELAGRCGASRARSAGHPQSRLHRLDPCRVAIAAALAVVMCHPAMAADKQKVAALVSTYYHNSHADVIVGRLVEGYTLDGQGPRPALELVSLYTDQVPANDKSRRVAGEHGVAIYDTVAGALTLGGDKLAVDAVLLVAEHGQYAVSATGQTQYPKRRLFGEVAEVFKASDRSVPVFIDKHLADNWEDAKWIYDKARRLKVPLLAGSSVPQTWRYPPVDPQRGAALAEIVAVSYHSLDAYGFHAMEMLQTMAERRQGGETGIKAVTCLEGNAVWEAGEKGVYDVKLLDAALGRLQDPRGGDKKLSERVPRPVLFKIEYADGLRASVLTLDGAVAEWAAAWRYAQGGQIESTLFWVQEARPFMHFTHLVQGIERMVLEGNPPWPVERTLLTSGALDALLISKADGGIRLETPHLVLSYQTDWKWEQPPAPPPGRPIEGP